MEKLRKWWKRWASFMGVMVGVFLVALAMLWWWQGRVDDCAARAKETPGELRNYAVPGTFGDAFAPIVGVMTALALGATVASAYMQREEMKEARAQFTFQAEAMADANDLAVTAQLVEVWRQIGELETQALAILGSSTMRKLGPFTTRRAQHWRSSVTQRGSASRGRSGERIGARASRSVCQHIVTFIRPSCTHSRPIGSSWNLACSSART